MSNIYQWKYLVGQYDIVIPRYKVNDFYIKHFSLWFEYQKGQIGIQVVLKVNIIMKKCQM
jgi:hypothetical protein